jgi:hypothetical protein
VEILEEIKNRLSPAGIGVIVKAIHTCVFASICFFLLARKNEQPYCVA